MPDIINAYKYTASEDLLIKAKISAPGFTHKNWSDDDLAGIRKSLRDHYRIEQTGVCCFCRNTVSLQSALNSHVEHIAPKSLYKDFMFNPKNLCVICTDCNEIKRNQEVFDKVPDTVTAGQTRRRYPYASSAFRIVHPHIDEYDDHILQVDKLYVDLTSKGHFTIGACGLNRFVHEFGWDQELINVPELMKMMSEFLSVTSPVDQLKKLTAIKRKLLKVKI